MLPGTNTGWPIAWYSGGRPGAPGPKARVAPLRCTHTFISLPSIRWVSILPMLWAISYTWCSCQCFTFPAKTSSKACRA